MALNASNLKQGRVHEFSTDMDYLTCPIRDELISRIEAVQGKKILLIDFIAHHGTYQEALNGANVDFHSILEDDKWSDGVHFPVEDGSCEMVIILFQLAWLDFQQLITEVTRVLLPAGTFHFSSLGPDTLIELKQILIQMANDPYMHAFDDMHYLGDCVVKTGLVKPLLDVDRLKVNYAHLTELISDLQRSGIMCWDVHRCRERMGKSTFNQFMGQFEADNPKGFEVTFEVIYGFAEKSANRPEAIKNTIRVEGPSL